MDDARPILINNGSIEKPGNYAILCEGKTLLLHDHCLLVEALDYLTKAYYVYNFSFRPMLQLFFTFILNKVYKIEYEYVEKEKENTKKKKKRTPLAKNVKYQTFLKDLEVIMEEERKKET